MTTASDRLRREPSPRRPPSVPRLLYIPEPEGRLPLLTRIASAMRLETGGDVAVLLRAPARPTRDLLALAALVGPIVRAAGATLLVSARCDLAIAALLDGVHLPAHGVPVDAARELLGGGVLVGRSCHDADELAEAEGADYVTLSPIGPVPGKGSPLGLEGFEALARLSPAPVLALGGVDCALAAELCRRGAHGVAVRRAVDASDDPAEAIRRFLRATAGPVSG